MKAPFKPSVTVRMVYNIALSLMNEKESALYVPEEAEYKARTLDILNTLQVELYPYSDTFRAREGERRRPVPRLLEYFDDILDLDADIALGVLPYGLAGQLQMDENNVRASFNWQRYEEKKALIARGAPQEWEPIRDVYGGMGEYNDFGAW